MGFSEAELAEMRHVLFEDPVQVAAFDAALAHETSEEGIRGARERLRLAGQAIVEAEGPDALFYPGEPQRRPGENRKNFQQRVAEHGQKRDGFLRWLLEEPID